MLFGKYLTAPLPMEVISDMKDRVAFDPRTEAYHSPANILNFVEGRCLSKRGAEMVRRRQLDRVPAPRRHRVCWMKTSYHAG